MLIKDLLEAKLLAEGKTSVINRIYGEVMAGLGKEGAKLSPTAKLTIKSGIEDAYEDGYEAGAEAAS